MTDQSRTDSLLVMVLIHLMKDASQKEKALALSKAGLTSAEIADALGTSAASVSQQLYEARKQANPRAKGRKTHAAKS